MRLDIYKKGQGKYTRLCTGFGLGIIVALGCLRLYQILQATALNLWVQTLVPAGLFVVFAILIYGVVNKQNIADFMIASEGEMKKVSWSSKQEIIVSTTVVISVVIFFAILFWILDLVFAWLFNEVIL